MATVSTIIQVIQAIPQLVKLIKSVVLMFRTSREDRKKSALNDGVDQTRQAKTKEEMQKANEETTRNLP